MLEAAKVAGGHGKASALKKKHKSNEIAVGPVMEVQATHADGQPLKLQLQVRLLAPPMRGCVRTSCRPSCSGCCTLRLTPPTAPAMSTTSSFTQCSVLALLASHSATRWSLHRNSK